MNDVTDRADKQRRTVERMLKAINDDKSQSAPGIHAENHVGYDRTLGASLESLKDFEEFGNKWISAIEDYRLDLENFFSSGMKGVFTYVLSGTLHATDSGEKYPIAIHGMSLLEFTEDNRICKEIAYFDLPSLLVQLDLPGISLDRLFSRVGL